MQNFNPIESMVRHGILREMPYYTAMSFYLCLLAQPEGYPILHADIADTLGVDPAQLTVAFGYLCDAGFIAKLPRKKIAFADISKPEVAKMVYDRMVEIRKFVAGPISQAKGAIDVRRWSNVTKLPHPIPAYSPRDEKPEDTEARPATEARMREIGAYQF